MISLRRTTGRVRRTTLLWALTLSVGIGGLLGAPPAAAQTLPLPDSMAAIGDSITQAYDVCCWYGNHPSHSWSTGGSGWDGIRSHYERILSIHPAIAGQKHNDAVSGAKMKAAPGQAAAAVSQNVEYVTILMGANDVCTSSRSTMTSVADFQAQFQEAMATLASGLSGAHVFVSSIPNIYRLWKLFHTKPEARFVWQVGDICQSMLSPTNSAADRQAVLNREKAFNDVLASVCAQYASCLFDDYAIFNHAFSASEVSTLDYFHPSLSGQATLAALTWAKSWWPAA